MAASILASLERWKLFGWGQSSYIGSCSPSRPHPDGEVGEWIQIRDRQSMPVETVVALPVKDPYHILRNVLLILELLEKEA
jgi:hypothetical protein